MEITPLGDKSNCFPKMNKKTRQGRKVTGGIFRKGGISQVFSYMFIPIKVKFMDYFTNNKACYVTKNRVL